MSTLTFLTELHRLRAIVEQTSNQWEFSAETPEPLRHQLFQLRDLLGSLEVKGASLESTAGDQASASLERAAESMARRNRDLAAGVQFAFEPSRFVQECSETISKLDRFVSLLPGDPTTPPPDF